MRKGLYHNLKAIPAINSASQAAAADGIEIDRKGSQGLMFIINTGAISGAGDFGVKVQESNSSGTGYTDADADDVISGVPATLGATAAYQVEYIGKKRFVRLALTKSGGTSIQAGAIALIGHQHIQLP
ncbi:hypothetical protein GB928_018675 [Shinella curvata]|uniref:Bacteriophage lambda head decoration protein D n=1 Tax=Shinella curvata TaxID=1817964 RepID=A0ABT8XHK1_9HYPH|nr:hypothetical protein [Shinella curvata]MCJ8053885.1 hypothetical protein [Shinella curvata]MDO6123217.1 hypothetical protein [Shinella curvata]